MRIGRNPWNLGPLLGGIVLFSVTGCVGSEKRAGAIVAAPEEPSDPVGPEPAPIEPSLSWADKRHAAGWSDNARAVSFGIEASVPVGAHVECRAAHASALSSTSFADCSVSEGIVNLSPAPTPDHTQGAYVLEARIVANDGEVLSSLQRSVYMHHSLDGKSPCSLGVSDDALIAKAREFVQADGVFGEASVVAAPSVKLFFAEGTQTELLSIARRFRLSADRQWLVVTRDHASRRELSCQPGIALNGRDLPRVWDPDHNGGTFVFSQTEVSCDALVSNAQGEGACLAVADGAISLVRNVARLSSKLQGFRSAGSFSPKTKDIENVKPYMIFLPD